MNSQRTMITGVRIGNVKKILRSRRAEILIIVFLLVFSLRVVNWFQYPYIVAQADIRPPFVQQAFNNRVLYTWDETDFGMPSVYQARILVPSYFFITFFQNLGVDLFTSQLMTFFLMYFAASLLMYLYVKLLTNGDIIAAFVAGVFLTANVYLISDREQTAISFIDTTLMILPSVLVLVEGILKKSYTLLALSGFLFILTYGVFPNYRVVVLGLITVALTLLFMFVKNGLNVNHERKQIRSSSISLDTQLMRQYLKFFAVFLVAVFFASIWIIALVFENFRSLVAAYQQTATPTILNLYVQLHDIPRLIADWSFYTGAFGKLYIPYSDIYLHNIPIIVLSYIPPLLAFLSVLTHKFRKTTIFFSGVALVALILASLGVTQLYSAFASNFPLMLEFRDSSQWLFFAVFSFSILVGIVASSLFHRLQRKVFQILSLSLIVIILLASSYPLVTGDVTRNWLDTNVKGSYFPSSCAELNNELSDDYWALLLPQRSTYVVYDFAEGPLSIGNPYPLIFSKPVITGLGSEYTYSKNVDLLNKIYGLMPANGTQTEGVPKFLGMLGIKYLILEKDLVSGNAYNISVLDLNQNENYTLVKDWDQVSLYSNGYALQRLYTADNVLNYTSLDDMFQVISGSSWETLQNSVLFDLTSPSKVEESGLTMLESFGWNELSPTAYSAHVESNDPFVLVFLESYDEHWKVYVNGNPVPERDHQEVNAFANGWLINQTGDLRISIQYETQSILLVSIVASLALPVLLLVFLNRNKFKKLIEASEQRAKIREN